jgi:hypothetical protein
LLLACVLNRLSVVNGLRGWLLFRLYLLWTIV